MIISACNRMVNPAGGAATSLARKSIGKPATTEVRGNSISSGFPAQAAPVMAGAGVAAAGAERFVVAVGAAVAAEEVEVAECGDTPLSSRPQRPRRNPANFDFNWIDITFY
jgi:hypothetical protein